MSAAEIVWEYDDCNGMSDTYEATHRGVQLSVVGWAYDAWWCADKDGTRVEGTAEDDDAAKRCAIAAGEALAAMFATLTNLPGRLTPVSEASWE